MNEILRGLVWLGVYLLLVCAPLVVLLLGTTPSGAGFWWEFAIALGFAGTAMMGVQFMLTARFKRATAPYGIDIIYYFHRHLAVVALVIIIAHPAVLLMAYPVLSGFLHPFRGPWHMTAGVWSVLAMSVLVASSLWRKPLGIEYDTWRVLHAALAVAAVTLALFHIQGVGFYVATPWKRVLWTGIVASLVAAALYVRVFRPWRLRNSPYDVAEVRPERGDCWTVALEPRGHSGFAYQPGQFAWLTIGRSPWSMKEHPFSFSSTPTRPGRLEFTIKELGDFTRTIGHVAVGETAYVDGPYGAFTVDRHAAGGHVFIAGGIGIAPIFSMLRALADRRHGGPLWLVYGNQKWERVPFREALEELRSRLDLKVVHVVQEPPDGWSGERGLPTGELLERHLPVSRDDVVYFVCGPNPMIEVVEKALYGLGVPLGRLHTELFDLA
ncbi:MAG TPA: ferric reductase-like transmembrane domain-containing protein [Vicinamibacterales bacterium]|nr:ferric reductase-like transmembrane domain-containing protein [Vicinamibacterales bacterium]